MTPQRYQRKRTKGYKLPPNTVSVTRPGRWGNPVKVGMGSVDTAEDCVKAHELILRIILVCEPKYLEPLRGKNLACFCPLVGQPCHADTLLKYANMDADKLSRELYRITPPAESLPQTSL